MAGKGTPPRRGSPKGLPKKTAAAGKDGRRAPSGSGGYGRKRLEGRGPTPKAEERTGHPAARRAGASAAGSAAHRPTSASASARTGGSATARTGGSATRKPAQRPASRGSEAAEHVAGRNSVLEALRARVPATSLHIAPGLDRDPRLAEAVSLAADRGVPVLESAKPELDRLTDRAVHQGLVLTVPPYAYAHPGDVLAVAQDSGTAPLIVALDGVTDPRNLGAIVRSAAAFGAHGIVVPARRSAGMTASAWKSSAGAAARIPVAQATNLTRSLREYAAAGLLVVGLDGAGSLDLDDFDAATDPLVLVVGAEGKGLSRLVGEACDLRLAIPIASAVESLNAGVAAGIALAEIARRRRH